VAPSGWRKSWYSRKVRIPQRRPPTVSIWSQGRATTGIGLASLAALVLIGVAYREFFTDKSLLATGPIAIGKGINIAGGPIIIQKSDGVTQGAPTPQPPQQPQLQKLPPREDTNPDANTKPPPPPAQKATSPPSTKPLQQDQRTQVVQSPARPPEPQHSEPQTNSGCAGENMGNLCGRDPMSGSPETTRQHLNSFTGEFQLRSSAPTSPSSLFRVVVPLNPK
jgi:hypothetical protein